MGNLTKGKVHMNVKNKRLSKEVNSIRARAYAYFNDLQEPVPSCNANEKYWNYVVKKWKSIY